MKVLRIIKLLFVELFVSLDGKKFLIIIKKWTEIVDPPSNCQAVFQFPIPKSESDWGRYYNPGDLYT